MEQGWSRLVQKKKVMNVMSVWKRALLHSSAEPSAISLYCTSLDPNPRPCFLYFNARSKTGPGIHCMGDSAHASPIPQNLGDSFTLVKYLQLYIPRCNLCTKPYLSPKSDYCFGLSPTPNPIRTLTLSLVYAWSVHALTLSTRRVQNSVESGPQKKNWPEEVQTFDLLILWSMLE